MIMLTYHRSKKRPRTDTETDFVRRPSPVDRRMLEASRTPSISRSSTPSVGTTSGTSLSSISVSTSPDVYNGVLDSQDGFVFARSVRYPCPLRLSLTYV
jgi:histone-lysine N-methyltransferase SUV39H